MRVLVVDDEDLVTRMLERMLQKDVDVTIARSAEEALARIGAPDAFDAILCDVSMPGMTGIDVYHRLLTEAPALAERMLFMTGGATTAAAAEFLHEMADREVSKPFDRGRLMAALEQLCGRGPGDDAA